LDEYTVVLDREVGGAPASGGLKVAAGRAVLVRAGEWVRYSPGGAEYLSVCLPPFSPDVVRRDT
jgi:hypothetical protein